MSANLSEGQTADPALVFSEIQVGNVDKNNDIINDFGSNLYEYQTKFLKLSAMVTPKRTGTFTVYVKLFKNGNPCAGKSSPEGYTTTTEFTFDSLEPDRYTFASWGNDIAGFWKADSYRFEIWDDSNHCLGTKSFTIY